jgi:Txe/YoeB family toxin of toxin-antitoxin system
MRLVFSEHAWEDYLHWQGTDRKVLKRINLLIQAVQHSPFEGIGKPEPLRSCFKIPQLAQYCVKSQLKMLIYSM